MLLSFVFVSGANEKRVVFAALLVLPNVNVLFVGETVFCSGAHENPAVVF